MITCKALFGTGCAYAFAMSKETPAQFLNRIETGEIQGVKLQEAIAALSEEDMVAVLVLHNERILARLCQDVG
jgi:hypothetical protein